MAGLQIASTIATRTRVRAPRRPLIWSQSHVASA